jgi:hypothetical protein
LADIGCSPSRGFDIPRSFRRAHRSFNRTAEILPLGSGEVVRKCGEGIDEGSTRRTGGSVLVKSGQGMS